LTLLVAFAIYLVPGITLLPPPKCHAGRIRLAGLRVSVKF